MHGTEHSDSAADGTIPRRAAYPVPEVAVLLGGVTERYVWTLLSRNELTSVKVGGRRLVPADDLDAFIEKLREQERQARAAASAA
jgi:excisionase family DNA binding protein